MAKKRHEPGAYCSHVKKSDTVLVLSGRSAGQRGRVTAVIPRMETAIVEGINLVTRHQKAKGGQRVTAEQQSGRIERPSPIHLSKLMVVCPSCHRQTRVGRREQEGRSVRVCKHEGCGEAMDKRK